MGWVPAYKHLGSRSLMSGMAGGRSTVPLARYEVRNMVSSDNFTSGS